MPKLRKGLWTFSSDLTYMDLHSDVDENRWSYFPATAKIKQTGVGTWLACVLLRPGLNLGLAFQLNSIQIRCRLLANTGQAVFRIQKRLILDETRVDPSILTRVKI